MDNLEIILAIAVVGMSIAIAATIIMTIALIRFIRKMNELDKQFEYTIDAFLDYKKGLDKK